MVSVKSRMSWVAALALIISVFVPLQGAPANADPATFTKTITVLGSNGLPYSGAQVELFYTNHATQTWVPTPAVTTDPSGVASITASVANSYVALSVEPRVGDTTTAVYTSVINSVSPLDSAESITLAPANMLVRILNSSNTDAAVGSFVVVPSDQVNGYPKTTIPVRQGTFGIAVSTAISPKDDYLGVGGPTDFDSVNRNYALRLSGSGNSATRTLYTDDTFTTVKIPVAGVYQLNLRAEEIHGQLKDSTGANLTLPTGVHGRVVFTPALSDGTPDRQFQGPKSSLFNADGTFTAGLPSTKPGKYLSQILLSGSADFPSFIGPAIWLNAQGQYSSTGGAGTYQSASAFVYSVNLPSATPNFVVKMLTSGSLAEPGYIDVDNQDNQGNWWGPNDTTNGLASFVLPQGNYDVRLSPFDKSEVQPDEQLQVRVNSSGQVSVSKNSGSNVSPDQSGVYVFQSVAPNVRLNVLEAGNSTSAIENGQLQVFSPTGRYIGNYYAGRGLVDLTLPDGSYKLKVIPWANKNLAIENYNLTIATAGTSVTLADSANAPISATNGRFTIRAATPNATFRIVDPTDGTTILSDGYLNYVLSGSNLWDGLDSIGTDIGVKLVDGTYNFDVNGGQALASTRYTAVKSGSSLTVTGPNGVVQPTSGVYLLSPAVPNVKVQIVDPTDGTTPLTNSFVDVLAVGANSSNGYGTWDQPIPLKLADGDYTFTANTNASGYAGAKYAVKIVNGVASIRNPDGIDLVAVNGVFKISPTVPNFSFKVVQPGTNTLVDGTWFEVFDFYSQQWISGTGTNGGLGYLKLPNGKYTLRVHMGQATIPGLADSEFVVEISNSGVTVTNKAGTGLSASSGVFPLALSNSNVQLKIQDPSNTANLLSNWSVSVNEIDASRNPFRYVANSQAPAGIAGLSLPDGHYSLELEPAYDASTALAKSRYELTVSGGGTVKVLKTWAGQVVSAASDGSFGVRPDASNFVIKVVDPAHPSQVINGSYVNIMNDGGQWLPGGGTNGAGKVAFNLAAGTYRVNVSPGNQISGLATKVYNLTIAADGTPTVTDSANNSVALDQTAGAFILTPASSNVSFKITDPTSGVILQNAYANIFQANGNNRGNWIANEYSGRLNFSLPDGDYLIEANGSTATENYANKLYKLHISAGVATYATLADVPITPTSSGILLTPAPANVKFNIVDPADGVSTLQQSYANVFETVNGNRGNWLSNSGGDHPGFSLPDGDYQLEINGSSSTSTYASKYFKLHVSGSTVTYSTLSGVEISPTSAGISLSPAVANALFSITNPDNGELVTQSWANVWDKNSNQWIAGTGSNQGYISFSLGEGSYTVEVNPGGTLGLAPSRYDFAVNSSGQVSVTGKTADSNNRFALPVASANLRLKVVSPSDPTKLIYNANVNVQNTETGNWVGTGGNTGYLALRLEDGSYLMQLDPGQNTAESLARKNYNVTVSGSGTSVDVQDVVIDGSTHTFTVSPALPAVKGLVKDTSGGLVQNSQVVPINSVTGEYLWPQGADSGPAGQFGISVPTGNYNLVAQVPWNYGYNLAKSAPCAVTVSGGVVTTTSTGGCVQSDQSVVLTLRAPNVSFLVEDSAGTPLQNATVSIQYGSWNVWASSNSSGRVSFFIDPAEIKAANSWASGTISLHAYIEPPYGNSNVVRAECTQGVNDTGTLCASLAPIDLNHPNTGYTGAINVQNPQVIRMAAPNTHLTVLHPDTTRVGAGAWVTLYREVPSAGCPACRSWLGGANTSADGTAAFNVDDETGYFSVEVNPTYNERGSYATVTYSHLTWADLNGSSRSVAAPNLKLTIEQPGSGHKAAKWSWVSVDTLNSAGTGVTGWLPGAGATDLGKLSLLLPSNGKFRLTVYPGGGSVGARTTCDVQTDNAGLVTLMNSSGNSCVTGSSNASGFTIGLSLGNVTGIVRHGTSHLALKGAIVYATKSGSAAQTFTTGDDGAFSFQLDPGDWLFQVFYVNEPTEHIEQNVIGQPQTIGVNPVQLTLDLAG